MAPDQLEEWKGLSLDFGKEKDLLSTEAEGMGVEIVEEGGLIDGFEPKNTEAFTENAETIEGHSEVAPKRHVTFEEGHTSIPPPLSLPSPNNDIPKRGTRKKRAPPEPRVMPRRSV